MYIICEQSYLACFLDYCDVIFYDTDPNMNVSLQLNFNIVNTGRLYL